MSLMAKKDFDDDSLPDTFGGLLIVSQLRGTLLTVVGGLERIEKRLELYESYR